MDITPEEKQKLQDFSKQYLQVEFKNLQLLREALVHKSYVNEIRPVKCEHNERLEFLGDAVLELVVTDHLFSTYPNRPEGELTSFRAALVRKESLSAAARKLSYGDHIYMSKGEEATGGRSRDYILANTYESVLGAIYLELGYDSCRKFVQRTLLPKLNEIVEHRLDVDPKSKLQEIVQELIRVTPSYKLISESGPDHDKQFTMALMIGDQRMITGTGGSKQAAEQNAAAHALESWPQLYSKYANSAKIHTQAK